MNEYLFSKKTFCGNCGATYKRKKCSKDVYWVCRKHDTKSDMCSSIRISQYVFECAFVRMYNKLSISYREILTPILVLLQQMRIKKTNGNTRMLDIYNELANGCTYNDNIEATERIVMK